MRKVYYKKHLAHILKETNEDEFVFQYDEKYVKDHPKDFLTFTMPVSHKPFKEKRLFSFFDGLIPEGWLLNIVS